MLYATENDWRAFNFFYKTLLSGYKSNSISWL